MAEPRSGKQDIDQEKAGLLAVPDANGGDLAGTACELEVARRTLTARAGERGPRSDGAAEAPMGYPPPEAELAVVMEEVARKLVESIPEKIAAASLQHVATALHIVISEMVRLQGGGPASSVEGDGGAGGEGALTDAERAARIVELLDAARARGAGSHAHSGHLEEAAALAAGGFADLDLDLAAPPAYPGLSGPDDGG